MQSQGLSAGNPDDVETTRGAPEGQGGDHPPGAWPPARNLARLALVPLERFMRIEAASGVVLLAAALIAIAWANSPWRSAYVALWHLPLGVRFGPLVFERDLHFWINDGLMTIFFFVVGLEIKRELYQGELSDLRRAALPVAAAIGGMIVPAAIFFAANSGHDSVRGWGVPMATDIAFAVGALALLGKRVPPSLRILLLALAVIDDIGAILVIAVFYSGDLSELGFLVAALGLVAIAGFKMLGVRSAWAYLVPGVTTWAGAYVAGIHPTLAGVAIGLMTPVTAWFGAERFVRRASSSAADILERSQDQHAILARLDEINRAGLEAVSPVDRLEHALHGWVAYGVMPLFAFANAGVEFGRVSVQGESLLVFIGIVLGLAVGKPAGILAVSAVLSRFGIVALPNGVRFRDVAVVGILAGIGFTMALFIAELAFPDGPLLDTGKLAIFVASAGAALIGLLAGWLLLSKNEQAP